MRLDSDRKW